jgi:hypothetical protein
MLIFPPNECTVLVTERQVKRSATITVQWQSGLGTSGWLLICKDLSTNHWNLSPRDSQVRSKSDKFILTKMISSSKLPQNIPSESKLFILFF